jgi:predicted PurR-regulated permease PerM
MAVPVSVPVPPTVDPKERRRLERRTNARLTELTVPELRRMMVTSLLFAVVLILFLWMVRTVIIAGFLGAVVAAYLRPVYHWFKDRIHHRGIAAMVAIFFLIGPLIGLLIWSYTEIAWFATHVAEHQQDITARIDLALRKLPFLTNVNVTQNVGQWVAAASNYGASIPGVVRAAMSRTMIGATIFLFTTFYVMVEWDSIISFIRARVPPRYTGLGEALRVNVQGVLYGAVYSTFLTQTIKSVIILTMNLMFGVPLAGVLALISFVIGFFPIVGSWSVYVPVALYLAIFEDAPAKAVIMVLIGFGVNTLYISTFQRPKIAAERSKVLNFYWMLVGLVTGVYTFGLVGILLGPILIGLLKAILDTITETQWAFSDDEGDLNGGGASSL